jgi:hypothetical protein
VLQVPCNSHLLQVPGMPPTVVLLCSPVMHACMCENVDVCLSQSMMCFNIAAAPKPCHLRAAIFVLFSCMNSGADMSSCACIFHLAIHAVERSCHMLHCPRSYMFIGTLSHTSSCIASLLHVGHVACNNNNQHLPSTSASRDAINQIACNSYSAVAYT